MVVEALARRHGVEVSADTDNGLCSAKDVLAVLSGHESNTLICLVREGTTPRRGADGAAHLEALRAEGPTSKILIDMANVECSVHRDDNDAEALASTVQKGLADLAAQLNGKRQQN